MKTKQSRLGSNWFKPLEIIWGLVWTKVWFRTLRWTLSMFLFCFSFILFLSPIFKMLGFDRNPSKGFGSTSSLFKPKGLVWPPPPPPLHQKGFGLNPPWDSCKLWFMFSSLFPVFFWFQPNFQKFWTPSSSPGNRRDRFLNPLRQTGLVYTLQT